MSHYILNKDRRWKNGVLPFEMSKTARALNEASKEDEGSGGKSIMARVIEEYKKKTNVQLVPRVPSQHKSYVKIVSSIYVKPGTCNSRLGRRGGRQDIKCALNAMSFGGLVHEFGHALGLTHEHQRWDRDDYVIVNLIKAQVDGFKGDMRKLKPIHYTMFGAYDYRSAMHYGKSAMMVRKGSTGSEMGSSSLGNGGLSTGDVAGLFKMYPGRRAPSRIKIRL